MKKLEKIIVITGPTASGKSDLAIKMAKEKYKKENIECVIISADSKQVYEYLDICTGKVMKEEMEGVVHYGLGVAQPMHSQDIKYNKYTTATWLMYAKNKIKEIINENKFPIICGGTGMYIDAILYGLTENPAPIANFKKEYENKSLFYMQNEIEKINKHFFEDLNNSEKNNKERLIRKLEILTQNKNINTNHIRELKYDAEIIVLNPDKKVLENNINIRCEKRWIKMLEETKYLLNIKKIDKDWLSKSGIEYNSIIKYFDGEIKNEEECKKNIILKSVQYTKRQITWNKKYNPLF